MFFFYRVQIKC